VLSTPANPYPWALGVNAAGTPTYNPFWEAIDQSLPIGIAGHSLGAIAVTPIGQENDPRIGAVISYDNLDANLPNDAQHPLHTPSLYFSVDYPFPQTPTPMSSNPNPTQHLVHAYSQLVAAGVDAMGDHVARERSLRIRLPALSGELSLEPLWRARHALLLARLVRPLRQA